MKSAAVAARIYLIRHGGTAWSLTGRHCGRTDLPLTDVGERQARRVGEPLRCMRVALVMVSPGRRALQTCELAGLRAAAYSEPNSVSGTMASLKA